MAIISSSTIICKLFPLLVCKVGHSMQEIFVLRTVLGTKNTTVNKGKVIALNETVFHRTINKQKGSQTCAIKKNNTH